MKIVKRTFLFAMAVAMIMSIMVMPAMASEPMDTEWLQEFRRFPEQNVSSYSTRYTYPLQRFLRLYPDSSYEIINSGGVDGIFGNGTARAVRDFQEATGFLSLTGSCNDDTWAAIPLYLGQTPIGGGYHDYSYGGTVFMKSGTYNGNFALYYYNISTGNPVYFHTVSGNIIYTIR